MRAIVNGKLYDTEKAWNITSLTEDGKEAFEIYITKKGNIFAVDVIKEIILDSDKLKKLLEGNPKCTDAYIEIFGMPEEA